VRNLFRIPGRFARSRTLTRVTAEPEQAGYRLRGWILVAVAAIVSVLPLLAATPKPPQDAPSQKQAKWVPPTSPDRGQQVFQQNCSRCHNAPEGFSPHVSGSVALHMRVRANLSAEDYKALLHFLNP